MKKSLIALAVLAASGAAMAQSSVTLYGIADLWFGSVSQDALNAAPNPNGTVSSTRTTVMQSGGVNGSRWGLKGSEDLGGGLKANFDFQQGFSMDTGAAGTATLAFSRQSWVGLSGGFGATRLGRTTTPYDDVNGSSNAMFDSALAPANNIFLSTGYNARPNNTFYYQAPNMGGLSGAVSYSLAEDAATDDTFSANLTYGAGPFKVQLAYQVEGESTGTTPKAEATYTRIGGSYAFGPLTAKGTYGQVDNYKGLSGKDGTDWQLGLDYAMGPWVFTGSYAETDIDGYSIPGNTVPPTVRLVNDEKRKGFGLGAAYSLSKRTYVYGGYEADRSEQSGRSDIEHSIFALGVNHKF